MNVDFNHSEITFQLIVESSPNAIVLVTTEGIIAYVNAQTEKLFGYQKREILGKPIEILIPQRFKASHDSSRKVYSTLPTVRSMVGRELFALRKDGSEFPVEVGLNPLVTTQGTLIQASIIDSSERKKVEEHFKLVVESAPNAMVLVDATGTIAMVNKQVENLFGYHRVDLIGRKIETLIPKRFSEHHPSNRIEFLKDAKARPMGAGRDLFALRKDGSEVEVEIGLNPLKTEGGTMVLASIIDITERKLRENLAKKKVELESRNKELEKFAYIASHDLQEPLRTLSNYIGLFEEDYAHHLDPDTRKYLDAMKTAAARMSRQVRSLLDFSRLGVGKVPVEVDMNKVVNNVLADLKTLVESAEAQIHLSKLPMVIGYDTELHTLIQNLLANAIKFRKKDEQPRIEISAAKEPNYWKFTVSDNGIGIASKYLERIFEVFQKLHPNTAYEGSGIGLSTCKRIAELHQGQIWVESEPDVGSRFHFTISDQLRGQ